MSAVVGLAYVNGRRIRKDLRPSHLGWRFEIVEGLDDGPAFRGDPSIVIPQMAGRLPVAAMPDGKTITLAGFVGHDAEGFASHRTYLDEIKEHFAREAGIGLLEATLEDGTVRVAIVQVAEIVSRARLTGLVDVEIDLEAVEPYWYGKWGTRTWGSLGPNRFGQGLRWGRSGDFVFRATGAVDYFEIDSGSPVDISRLRATFDGDEASGTSEWPPAEGEDAYFPGIEYVPDDGSDPIGVRMKGNPPYLPQGGAGPIIVGDTFALNPGASLVIDNSTGEITYWDPDGGHDLSWWTTIADYPIEGVMERSAGNRGGEWLRLPAGRSRFRVYGGYRVRLSWDVTYP